MARCISLIVLALCACSAKTKVVLPDLAGYGTLLAERTPEAVDVHDLATVPRIEIEWEPRSGDDRLRIFLFRGSPRDLELGVTDGLLDLDLNGIDLPQPARAYTLDGDADTARETTPARGALKIAQQGCERLTFEPFTLPVMWLSYEVLAPDGRRVMGIGNVGVSPPPVYVMSSTASTLIGGGERPFAAKDEGVWLVRSADMVRFGAGLEILESIDTSTLGVTLVSGVETSGTPRFYVMSSAGEFFAWEGRGPLASIGRPSGDMLPNAQMTARVDGELWINWGPHFARYTPGEGWLDELVAPIGTSGSKLADTAWGTLLSVYSFNFVEGTEAWLLVRRGDAWEPLLPRNTTITHAIAELDGRLYGAVQEGIVEIHPGAFEREPSVCMVAAVTPVPQTLVATSDGLYVYAAYASSLGGFARR